MVDIWFEKLIEGKVKMSTLSCTKWSLIEAGYIIKRSSIEIVLNKINQHKITSISSPYIQSLCQYEELVSVVVTLSRPSPHGDVTQSALQTNQIHSPRC